VEGIQPLTLTVLLHYVQQRDTLGEVVLDLVAL